MKKLSDGSRPVAIWIGIGVAMLVIQIILGGVTRLTGSGLSITEWNVVTGALPPLTEQQWLNEFAKYKQTSQFQLLNIDFKLENFKFIFFWEWLHRFWARLIGVVFLVGFFYLLGKRYLKNEMIRPLLILFVFGALQGAIGWIMVKSGLSGDAVYVKPTKLALHFIFAIALIVFTFWFFLQLTIPQNERVNKPKLRSLTLIVLLTVGIQLLFGALMAGHKAATAAPTWPDINGALMPPLFGRSPALINFIENKITIHFFHRTLGYLILLLVLYFTFITGKPRLQSPTFNRLRYIPLILVSVQVILGVSSLLLSPEIVPGTWGDFEWMAQLHQITAMLLVLSLVAIFYMAF